jgi:hypothetical protein
MLLSSRACEREEKMIEFLDNHPPRPRSTPALRATLASGFLGFCSELLR